MTAASTSWLDRTTLTGNWGGARITLEDKGVQLRAEFTSESAANLVDEEKQTARYTQQVAFGADLDLSRLIGDPGATFEITFNDRAGRSLSADAIGNLFAVQQLYGAGQNLRLVELNYQQSLFANKLNLHLGWSPVGEEFASLPIFCYFQTGFICGHVSAMTTNSRAQNYPTGQWNASIKVSPISQFYTQTGAFQVNPDRANSDKGFDLSFSGTGVLYLLNLVGCPGIIAENFRVFIRWELTIIRPKHSTCYRIFMDCQRAYWSTLHYARWALRRVWDGGSSHSAGRF